MVEDDHWRGRKLINFIKTIGVKIKFFKDLSWREWFFAVIVGIVIGQGAYSGVKYAIDIGNRLKVNEELVSAGLEDRFSVFKAFRINDIYTDEKYVYIKWDFIKQRDCGAVQNVQLIYFGSDGQLHTVTNIIAAETSKPLTALPPRPVSEDWQVGLYYWKIKKTDLQANAFYIRTEHICPAGGDSPIDNNNNGGDQAVALPPDSMAGTENPTASDIIPPPQRPQVLIVRIYGPFIIKK